MDKLKLKWRIFGFLLGLCGLLLIILWLFQTVFLNEVYQFSRMLEIGNAIELVRANMDNPEFHNLILNLEKDKEIFITPASEYMINAINYSGEDKTIAVRQIVADGYVKIEIQDSGEGIAEESLPYIWDRYYKVDKKHKRAYTGTGLGLSIVKKVVSLHNGECGAESQEGKGSTFWFRLKICGE